jgi:hypothetical protein
MICQLRYGAGLDQYGEELRKELYAYLRSPARPTGSSVGPSRQAVKRWFEVESSVERPQGLAFLYSYLLWNETWISPNDGVFEQVRMFLTSNQHSVRAAHPGSIPSHEVNQNSHGWNNFLEGLARASSRIRQREHADLFYTSSREVSEEGDQSYYVLYRYSTNPGLVLKSFMVCRKPRRRILSNYTYVTFRGRIRGTDTAGESEGVISKLPLGYYWVGYNYEVPIESSRPLREYQNRRVHAKGNAVSVEIMAVEYRDIAKSLGLFSGLMLSAGALRQPAIGRVAALHIGTKASLGRYLSDRIIIPTEVRQEEVGVDLYAMIGRMIDAGYGKFGRHLSSALSRRRWNHNSAETIAMRILREIDNSPARERGDAVHGSQLMQAIESFSRQRENPYSSNAKDS